MVLGVMWSERLIESASHAVQRLKRVGALDSPAAFPLCLAVVLVCASAWTPFDITLDVGNAFAKLRALHRDVWQADGPVNELMEMIRFAVLTMLAARWLRDIGVR